MTTRKKLQEEPWQSNSTLSFLTDNIADILWAVDLDLRATFVSPSVEPLLGFTPDEWKQRRFEETVTPESAARVFSTLKQQLELEATGTADPKRSFTIEAEYYCKDGSTVWLEQVAKGIRGSGGDLTGILGVARDITQRRLAEEELRLRGMLPDNTIDAIYMVNEKGLILYANEAACTMTGFSRNDLLSMSMQDINPPDFADKLPARMRTLVEHNEHSFETRHRRADGSEVDVAVKGSTFETGGARFFVGVARDITETKRMETELRASEEKYRQLFEQSVDAVSLMTVDGRHIASNPAWFTLFGYTAEDHVSLNARDLYLNPDERDTFVKTMSRQERLEGEVQFKRKDGTVFDCHRVVTVRRASDGSVIGFQAVNRDITAQKSAEQALREAAEKYRTLVNSIIDVVYSVDADGIITFISPQVESLAGIRPDELVGRRFTEFVHPDDLPTLAQSWARLVQDTLEPFDFRVFDAEGRVRHVRSSSSPHFTDGVFTGAIGSIAEITGRVEAEQALQQSERKYRELFEQSVDAVNLVSPDGRILEANPAWFRLSGYTPETMSSYTARDAYVDPEGRARFLQAIALRDQVEDELQFRRKDGTIFDCHRIVTVRRAPDSSIVGFQTVFHDITDSKAAEQALRESEERFRELFELSRDATYLLTADGHFIAVNQAWLNLFGYTPEEVQHLDPHDLYEVPAERDDILLPKLQLESAITDMEVRFKKQDGTGIDCLISLVAHRDRKGEMVAIHGVAHDITRQKKADRSLRESEARFRTLSENLDDTVARIDRDCRILYVNPALDRLSGQPHLEMVGHVLSDIPGFSSATLDATSDAIMHVFNTGRPLSGSMDVQTHSGQRFIDWHISPERDDDGVLQTVLIHLHDVTALRETQEELRLAGERHRELSGHLQAAREHERTALARDLHDNIGQGLTALKFDLVSLKKQLQQESRQKGAINRLEGITTMLDTLALDVRQLSTELRPGMLDDLGLCAAMEWQVNSFVERTGIQCELSLPENDAQIPPTHAIVLYRVLQELLTNIARHSKATSARASLFMNEDSITLEIADNGIGISSSGVETSDSFGILGIRERLRPIEGEFTISGKRHKGTVATVRLPLTEPSETNNSA